MGVEIAIRNYEDALIGRRRFSLKIPGYLERKPTREKGTFEDLERARDIQASKENDALAVVRYAITNILGWTPQEAFVFFNKEVMQKLKLDQACKYIQFPRDLSPNSDYWWIIYKAFPTKVSYEPYQRVLNMYKRLLKGEIKHFPRNVFDGTEGAEYLNALLHYFISENIPANTVEDLYDAFGHSANIVKELKKAKLFYAYKNKFYSPLDWLHSSLEDESNSLYYHYQQYMDVFEKTSQNIKQKKKEEVEAV